MTENSKATFSLPASAQELQRIGAEITRSWGPVVSAFQLRQRMFDQLLPTHAFRSLALGALSSNVSVVTSGFWAQLTEASEMIRRVTESFTGPFARLAAEYRELLPPFLAAMIYAGWPPPADESGITIGSMRKVADAWNNGDEEEARRRLDAFMLRSHRDVVLEEMKRSWHEKYLLRRRMEILTAGLAAHSRRDYFCSVPTLLSQVEGILADGFSHSGKMFSSTYREYLNELLAPPSEERLRNGFDRVLREFFNTTFLAQFEHGADIPTQVSRHAILHGADTGFANEPTSLKVILTVNALQDSFHLVALPGSRVFHYAGCPLIRKSRSKRTHFQRTRQIPQGLRPCKVCLPKAVD